MRFYMPTKVFSEADCVMQHGAELAALGTRALIVTGRSSSQKNGSLDDVIKVLDKHQIPYTVFNDVEENPSVETVMKARNLGISFGADFVIGIGGGSPLDASKAIAVMIHNPDKDWQYLYENTLLKALPIAAVPTTCGTGSEVTGVAVLTRHDLKTKMSMTHRIFPTLALVDGKYILKAPHHIIVNTAIDALSHLIESCINTLADDYSDMTAFAGLNAWRECKPFIENEQKLTHEAAQKLMNTSTLAGMSIAQVGTTIPHALSYMLTYQGGIPHGIAVGIFQANYLAFAGKNRKNAILSAAGFTSTDELKECIRRLAPVTVDKALLKQSAQAVLNNPAKLRLCPYPIDERVMEQLIQGISN